MERSKIIIFSFLASLLSFWDVSHKNRNNQVIYLYSLQIMGI